MRLIEWIKGVFDKFLSSEESQLRSAWYRQEIIEAYNNKDYERAQFLEQEM